VVELYHSTDDDGAEGIKRDGFARSALPDSPDATWLATTRTEAAAVAARHGWFVIVDIPDEIAAHHLYRFGDGTPYPGVYLVPWDVLNAHQPFAFESAL
jgi:hypothetical protein